MQNLGARKAVPLRMADVRFIPLPVDSGLIV